MLDIFLFEKYLRYTFSPYLQLAYGLSGNLKAIDIIFLESNYNDCIYLGILSKNWDPNSASAIIVLV